MEKLTTRRLKSQCPPKPIRIPRNGLAVLGLGTLLLLLASCDKGEQASTPSARDTNRSAVQGPPAPAETPMATQAGNPRVPVYSYEVINTWPHDRDAYTQGLVFLDGALFESTGLNGRSTLRRVDLKTGSVLKQVQVPAEYFAEGIAVLNGKIFQLTWQNGKGFVYDLQTFHLEKEFAFTGEGWGLATDGKWLILSDGTERIRFLDPITFEVNRTVQVNAQGQPVRWLNELEYIKGEIFANVWQTEVVARIDPATGKVIGIIDFRGLLAPEDRAPDTDVFNGIAYDAEGDRLFVTGKRWPKLFEVRLKLK